MPVRQDLYWVWAEKTNYASYGVVAPGWYIQVLVELLDEKTPQDLQNWLQSRARGPRSRAKGFVPVIYKKNASLRFCTAWIARKEIENLPVDIVKRFKLGAAVESVASSNWVKEFQDAAQTPEQAVAASPAYLPDSQVNGQVLLAIIDDDINFKHATFADGHGNSRFAITWDQNTNQSRSVKAPRFGYTLNGTHKSLKSEKQVASHGTMVASLAGGKETPQYRLRHSNLVFNFPGKSDNASDVTLAGVVLPMRTVADTSGGALAVNVYDALTFLTDPRNVAPDTHLIVNLSFGNMAGPHDGTTLLDAALRDMLTRRHERLTFLVPAGNSFESQCHSRFELVPDQSQLTVWRVLPDDRTPSFLEIWLPKGSTAKISLQSPGGTALLRSVAAEDTQFIYGTDGKPYAAIVRSDKPANGENGQMVLLAISPTRADGLGVSAPHGDWECLVENISRDPLPVRLWVERDNASFGKPTRGRQSYLVDPDAVRKPGIAYRRQKGTKITGYGSLNAMACETTTLVVGGYDLKTADITPESAAGSSDDGVRCPDGVAPSSESPLLPGLLGVAHSGGGMVRMGGTSAATPLATRFLVNELIAGRSIYRPAPNSQVNSKHYDERAGFGSMEF